MIMMQFPWPKTLFSWRHSTSLWLFLCALFAAALSSQSQADSLTSTVNRDLISVDETLELTVRYSGKRTQQQPDFSQLSEDFEILSTSQSNQFQSINGKVTSSTNWTMILAPRQKGRLIVPSFRFDGQVSDALIVSVVEAAPTPAGKVKDVFIETVVDKNSVYVQEEVIVRYKLYYSINVDSLDAQPLKLDNVVKVDLPDTRYTRKIDNKLYRVAEYAYALFPQNSGTLEIPVLLWDLKIPKKNSNRTLFGFSGRYEISRQRTEKKTIEVRPRPASFPAGKPWIPARELTLQQAWSSPPSTFKVGEPITRNITLKAKGLMASQLPQITQDIDNGDVKTYADQPSINDDKSDKGVQAERVESAAVVIAGNGPITLPKIRIPWWDTSTDSLKYAEIPAQTIQSSAPAVGNTNSGRSANTAAPSTSEVPEPDQISVSEQSSAAIENLKDQVLLWQAVCLFLLLTLLSNIALWWRSRKGLASKPKAHSKQAGKKVLWSQLAKSCKTNKPQDIRDTLLVWAKYYWQDDKIFTLDDIGKKVNDDEVIQQLRQLDMALYSTKTGDNVSGEKLIKALKQAIDKQHSSKENDQLQAFYAT